MPALTVPTTGPRSCAEAALQWIGKRVATPVRPGCEVSRIWPVRLVFVMCSAARGRSKSNKPPARLLPNERPDFVAPEYGAESAKNQAFAAVTKVRASMAISAAERPGLYSAEPMPYPDAPASR